MTKELPNTYKTDEEMRLGQKEQRAKFFIESGVQVFADAFNNWLNAHHQTQAEKFFKPANLKPLKTYAQRYKDDYSFDEIMFFSDPKIVKMHDKLVAEFNQQLKTNPDRLILKEIVNKARELFKKYGDM